ncbi:MAG: Ig-like domain-containing protein [Dehalococcoidales bacterium]|nr:Ig-like domain-containing protein [Dehalococcoidales bacterium]
MKMRIYRFVQILLMPVLLITLLSYSPPAAVHAEGEEDTWDVLMAQFQELATEQAYGALDDKFSDISGFSVIDKAQKINEVIEDLEGIESYYNRVIGATPGNQNDINFLAGVADAFDAGSSYVPVPLVGDFLGFYATGIRTAVTLLQQLDQELREMCIAAAIPPNPSDDDAFYLDFSVYTRYEEQVQALRKKREQDLLAERAKRAVQRKMAKLERKKAEMEAFCVTGNVTDDAEKGFTLFVQRVVERVEELGGRGVRYEYQFDALVRSVKRQYRTFFEITSPRDALEAQYSGWIDDLVQDAKDTVAATCAHLPILRQTQSNLTEAERALKYVKNIVGVVGDETDEQTRTDITANITWLKGETNVLKEPSIPAGTPVNTKEEAEQRLAWIRADYDKSGNATTLLNESVTVLQQANDFKTNIMNKLADAKAQMPVGIPYRVSYWSETLEYVSADAVTELVVGYPRSIEPGFYIEAYVAHLETEIIDGEEVPYYWFEEGQSSVSLDYTVEEEGIVSLDDTSGELVVTGVGAGTTGVAASVMGKTNFTFGFGEGGHYSQSQFESLQDDLLSRTIDFSVHEYTFTEIDPLSMELFTTSTEWDEALDNAMIDSEPHFMRTYAYDRRFEEGQVIPDVSNPAAVYVEPRSIIQAYQGPGTFTVYAVDPGYSDINFDIIGLDDSVLATTPIPVTSSRVYVYSGNVSLEGVPLETTAEGYPVNRIRAYVHAGESMELRVEVDGPANLDEYECHWHRLSIPSYHYPEVLYETTYFSGNVSRNWLQVPVDARPGTTSYWLEVEICLSSYPYTKVFEGVVPGIQVRYPKLSQSSLFVGMAEGEIPRLMNELHLFKGRTGYRTEVEIFPAGYFIDQVNNTVTKDIWGTTDFLDAEAYFHKYVGMLHEPNTVYFVTRVASNDYYYFMKPLNPGITSLYSLSLPYSSYVYIEDGKSYVRSANPMSVYVDAMSLDYPAWDATITEGETRKYTLTVETTGNLSDYECVWSLDPVIGTMDYLVTDFVDDGTDNWTSENTWHVPGGVDGQQVKVEASVRLKTSEHSLGKDSSSTTITPPSLRVVTGAADNITPHEARLTGTLDIIDAAATANVTFEWGTDPDNLTNQTPLQPMTSTGNISTGLSNLQPSTTYYYRTVVTDSTGTTACGETLNFTTGKVLIGLEILPDEKVIGVGQVRQYSARGVYSDASTTGQLDGVTWESSNTNVASVGVNTGVVAGLGYGQVTISAWKDQVSGSINLTVTTSMTVNSGKPVPLFQNEDNPVEIPVDIKGLIGTDPENGLKSFIIELSWNPAVFQVNGVQPSQEALAAGWNISLQGINNAAGSVTIAGNTSAGQYDDIRLLVLSVTEAGETGNQTPFIISSIFVTDLSGQTVEVIPVNTFARILIRGDVNEDGGVNIQDAAGLARMILGMDNESITGDANGDGKLNVFDITRVIRIILGLNT